MEEITYSVERKFFKLVGAEVRTYDSQRNLVCFASAKAFKLREEITFYRDDTKSVPLFQVKARQIIDIGATYDITDVNGQRLGSLKRKGLASAFIRDKWLILTPDEQELGEISEDSNLFALLRRYIDFVSFILPQRFHITVGGQEVGQLQQNKNPLTVKLQCTYKATAASQLGQTFALAIPNLLAIIEARQN